MIEGIQMRPGRGRSLTTRSAQSPGDRLFGLVSATLASLFVENDTKDEYEDIRSR